MTALRKGFRLVHARLAPCLVSGLLAIGPLGNAWAGDVRYAYDARGRLAAVTAEDGATYAYLYDEAGNLLSVYTVRLLITEITPTRGEEGEAVTLQGIGFDSGSNVVRFNGTPATVTSATATEIHTTVPAGATSGPVTVQNGLGTTRSLIEFLVLGGPPGISGFTPAKGEAGTSIVLSGSGFVEQEEDNTVTLNGVLATVASSSATSLSFVVPTGIGSGKIVLSTPEGSASAAGDFLVAPPGYEPADIERGVRTGFGTPSPTPVPVALGQAGKVGLVLFEATAGQRLGIELGADAGLCTKELLVRPDNTVFRDTNDFTLHCGAAFREPERLDQTGTWTLVLDPNGVTTGTRNVTLHEVPDDPRTELAFNSSGAVGILATTAPGQNAQFTFQAQAGDDLSFTGVVADANPPECLTWRILRPNGTQFAADSCVGTGFFHDRTRLDTSGIWTVVGDEADRPPVHEYRIALYKVPADVTRTVPQNGTQVSLTTTTPGQNARFTFTRITPGTMQFTGQFLRPGCSAEGSFTCRVWRVIRPNGSVLGQSSCIGATYTSTPINLTNLGLWTIEADEQGPETHCHTLSVTVQ